MKIGFVGRVALWVDAMETRLVRSRDSVDDCTDQTIYNLVREYSCVVINEKNDKCHNFKYLSVIDRWTAFHPFSNPNRYNSTNPASKT